MKDASGDAPRPPFDSPSAPAFRCASCGAPADAGQRICAHCGALLSTRRCAACFHLSPADAARCARCGALLPRDETDAPGEATCPDCRVPMDARRAGALGFAECPRCAALFLRKDAFDHVARDADARAVARLMEPNAIKPAAGVMRFHYRKCPACGKLMNRTNFAAGSGVVIDVCKTDGVFFDAGELTTIVDFVETGGYEKARQREKERLNQELADLEMRKSAAEPSLLAQPVESRGAGILGFLADLFLNLR